MKIIGFKRVDYVSKKTNKPIKGYEIHCVRPISDKVGEGFYPVSVYVSDAVLSKNGYVPALDEDIEVYYNAYGGVLLIRLLSPISDNFSTSDNFSEADIPF